jgi:hypothetical protein
MSAPCGSSKADRVTSTREGVHIAAGSEVIEEEEAEEEGAEEEGAEREGVDAIVISKQSNAAGVWRIPLPQR